MIPRLLRADEIETRVKQLISVQEGCPLKFEGGSKDV